ncbi:hypothetical protein DSL72_002145 [Monilinia vaccinii-corymbosi]|uniref:Extracellular membrane protein CFEM domain-containing protein n=1 Tax=Monilinia vaccinii-corymbosi TaxID=61207 RepID=A0A8A3PBV7_9HELO|nr:hypothetical protein DSL72_002145 [Monilinia vaccinii-corymbosi]
MHFSTAALPLALLVSYVAAQSSAVAAAPAATAGSSSSTCQGQNVLDACLSSTTAIANACQSTDYNCLCTGWNAVLTCYNECPNDSGYAGALSNKQTYCNDASVYTSTSSSAISRDWSTSATASLTGAETAARSATRTGGSDTASATRSAASADNTSGAGERRVGNIMGVLGGVGAVAAVFL